MIARGIFIVITLNDGAVHFTNDFEALRRIGIIADDVTETHVVRTMLLASVR
jgi:hypothetical protein